MRLAFYAHYSNSEDVALRVFYYLEKLHELGFHICFISNSPVPPHKEQELDRICDKIIQRANVGFDFGMWQRALVEYPLDSIDELLLTNSSIVGPLHPMAPLWNDPSLATADFWGLTDNDEFGRHLQSYFIVFRRAALEHPCFYDFWDSGSIMGDRQSIIERYEIGLTRYLERNGLRWSALFPQEKARALLAKHRGIIEELRYRFGVSTLPRNSSMAMADLLLELGMPFMKTKLLNSGGLTHQQVSRETAIRLIRTSSLPRAMVDELLAESVRSSSTRHD